MSTTVSPTNIPKKMTQAQKEYWVLFGICVAGKGADQTHKKLNAFLAGLHKDWTGPFELIRTMSDGLLHWAVREYKFGQYTRIETAFREAAKLDVGTMTVEKLENVPGIGPKTARMIILYTQPNANCVPLDTHILKFLKRIGIEGVPSSTPPAGRLYDRLEKEFVRTAGLLEMTVRELDTFVWTAYHANDLSKLPGLSDAKEAAQAKD